MALEKIKISKSKEKLTIENGIVKISYSLNQGMFDYTYNRKGIFNIYLSLLADEEIISSYDATKEEWAEENIEDEIGKGKEISFIFRKIKEKVDIILKVKMYLDKPFVIWKAEVKNLGEDNIKIGALYPLKISQEKNGKLQLGSSLKNYRVYIESDASGGYTGVKGISDISKIESAWISEIYNPEEDFTFCSGCLTCKEAWTKVITEYNQKDGLRNWYFKLSFADFLLSKGKSISSDSIMLSFYKSPFKALEEYGNLVHNLNHLKEFTNKDIPVGWGSWYSSDVWLQGVCGPKGNYINEEKVLESAEFIAKNFKDYGVNLIQLDHGWQWKDTMGEWSNNERNFPHGIKWLAERLKSYGLNLGLWISPFAVSENTSVYKEHPGWMVQDNSGKTKVAFEWHMLTPPPVKTYTLDPTHPEARKWLRDTFKHLASYGCKFFKCDFAGGPGDLKGSFYQKDIPKGVRIFREGFSIIRHAIGKGVDIQSCSCPIYGTLGITSSNRIEQDICGIRVGNEYFKELKKVARGIASKYWQHKRLWINDPDNLSVGGYEKFRRFNTKAEYEEAKTKSYEEAKIRLTIACLSGGVLLLGDRFKELEEDRLRLILLCLPIYGEAARPIDMFEKEIPEIWDLKVNTNWDNWDVVALFNWNEKSKVIKFNFDELELNRNKKYLVYEFWGKQFLGIKEYGVKLSVEPHTTKLLIIKKLPERPSVLSTDMHLTQGGVEISEVKWNKEDKILI